MYTDPCDDLVGHHLVLDDICNVMDSRLFRYYCAKHWGKNHHAVVMNLISLLYQFLFVVAEKHENEKAVWLCKTLQRT